MVDYFSPIYNQSFSFLKDVGTGLSRITDYLFLPLRDLIAPAFGVTPENFFPNVHLLDNSTITFVVGSGIVIYIGLALFKFAQDAIS